LSPANGTHLALLWYDDVRTAALPREFLLDFLESAYQAGALTAGWDRRALASSWCPPERLAAALEGG
jgi:hypothetical protein